jgi:glutamyl-tRNA synthetase
MIYQAFGWGQPIWVHLSVFLNPSGRGKMSKRHAVDAKGGAMSIYPLDMRTMGYLPEAIVNWIALMGWSYDDRTEQFTLDELAERFSLEKLNPSPAAVNFSKLEHFNGVYIRSLSIEDLAKRLAPFFRAAGLEPEPARLLAITPLIQERINTLEEAVEIAGFFFRSGVSPAPDHLVGKNMDAQASAEAARQAREAISQVETMEPSTLEPRLRALAEKLGLSAGQLFGILRIAVTGQPVSPPLIETMHVLGKTEVVSRIDRAVELLEGLAPQV